MSSFKTIGLIGKHQSPDIAVYVQKLAAFLAQRGVRVLIEELSVSNAGSSQAGVPVLPIDEIGKQADLAIVVGGDGTLLYVARTLASHDVALVGVNQGRLGFLTDISSDTMCETIAAILDGKYIEEQRMVLESEVVRDGKKTFDALAFNEVVVAKGAGGNMVELEVRIDGKFLYDIRADGLIVATPTGSTAYALSSGGPILHPALSVLTLVPICPHTFSSRPIVLSSESVVEIRIVDAEDARAHFDGHAHVELKHGDRIVARRHARAVRLLHPENHDYYNTLRAKLHWTSGPER